MSQVMGPESNCTIVGINATRGFNSNLNPCMKYTYYLSKHSAHQTEAVE